MIFWCSRTRESLKRLKFLFVFVVLHVMRGDFWMSKDSFRRFLNVEFNCLNRRNVAKHRLSECACLIQMGFNEM